MKLCRPGGSGGGFCRPPRRFRLADPLLLCWERDRLSSGSSSYQLYITRAVTGCMWWKKWSISRADTDLCNTLLHLVTVYSQQTQICVTCNFVIVYSEQTQIYMCNTLLHLIGYSIFRADTADTDPCNTLLHLVTVHSNTSMLLSLWSQVTHFLVNSNIVQPGCSSPFTRNQSSWSSTGGSASPSAYRS